ncbi:PAS domain-containing protein [Limibaculum sp. FT325]|uniref:PAS domain-containing protein n=1 Tax=Thermohalobaculum sediminis TaxID=2939436 RepID=UPI0020BF8AFB|nr:PAS domain-containing protein [Limibaculum sediminis]MCL5775716.1 PAS domain-containing protein [Limibaculum sediminis]
MGYLTRNNSSILHPEIRALEAYWQDLRAGRACPYRAEVDPRDIPSKIGHLFILEDVGLGNMRFRICGTALADSFGMELRGMPVGAIMDIGARQSLIELLRETLAEPGVGHARMRRADGRHEAWEIVFLPLRSDNGRVDRVIGALHCLEDGAARSGNQPLRFTIDAMSVAPVEITVEARENTAYGGGFTEGGATFAARPGVMPRGAARRGLVAIAGGLEAGTAGGGDGPERPRPRLRLVSDT